ncbi:hypothetical protein EJ08DRAFT_643002 [Tothia fuscella]|uniref:N-acetylglucosamine-induced protein 1 n=1 Tax=Tothia fuscella TaxID=1048955 RepID=A0A9P4NF35_9PEZI|nr:hypothetical protein EJ08DRAFT_643002 [Tothia fuscella]
MPAEEISWWNFNIPHEERTKECPDFLVGSSEKDMRLIGKWDADHESLTWDEVKELISTNRIDLFRRKPSDLRCYRNYVHNLKNEYGSVLYHIQHNLLQWPDLTPQGAPFTFTCPGDVKVTYNDWPYGIDSHIVHLVVWTKFRFEEDSENGDLTPKARKQIEDYVDGNFRSRIDADHVIWFKNWKSLKSVHAVEHFHVMLYDPDMAFVAEITGGHVQAYDVAQGAGCTTAIPQKDPAY